MNTRILIASAAMVAFAAAASAQPAPRPAQPTPPTTPVPAPPSTATPAPAPPTTQGTADAPPASERPLYLVEGFRSARFNMTEPEVREAILRDFPRTGSGARRTGEPDSQPNRVFRTTALVITVRDLMPDTGSVRIEYILGYQSRRLIQVNLIWGNPADPQAPADVVQTVATRLQAFFARENFAPDSRMAGAVQQDGTIIVFRGRDPQARVVEVIAKPPTAAREGQRPDQWVRLSYIANPERPDVYTLRRGDF